MKKYLLIIAIVNWLSAPVNAATMYKCTINERIVFQDKPCPGNSNATPIDLPSDKNNQTRVSIPGRAWALQFSPKITENRRNQERNGDFSWEGIAAGAVVVTLFVESAQGKGTTPQTCMNYYWSLARQNRLVSKESVIPFQSSEFPGVVYATANNVIVQSNMNFYGYRDGQCIDVHISKTFGPNSDPDLKELFLLKKSLTYVGQ